jgi:hypothetical protein
MRDGWWGCWMGSVDALPLVASCESGAVGETDGGTGRDFLISIYNLQVHTHHFQIHKLPFHINIPHLQS